MSGQLPNLLDRDFVVGYFLPVLTFLAASLGLIAVFGQSSVVLELFAQDRFVLATTIIGLASGLGGVLLLVFNRNIIRLMEGYGAANPAHLLKGIQRRRYENLTRTISELNAERQLRISRGQEFPEKLRQQRTRLTRIKAERFPHHESYLLPTALGNTFRAFESYPYVMYGIDAIEGWNRLLAVIPKDYRVLLDSAKAQIDFWANLWLLSLLLVLEYIIFTLYTKTLIMPWIPVLAIAVTLFASSGARNAAIEWGSLLKASFDVFLPQLREKLQLPFPASIDEERMQWNQFTRAFLYRNPADVLSRSEPPVPMIGVTGSKTEGSSPDSPALTARPDESTSTGGGMSGARQEEASATGGGTSDTNPEQ